MANGTVGSEGTSTFVGWDQLAINLREALRKEPPAFALGYFFQFRLNLDDEIEHRDRRGELQCARPVVDGKEVHQGKHEENISETEETTIEIAEEISTEISAGIQSTLGGELGIAGAKLTNSIQSSLNAKKTSKNTIKVTLKAMTQVSAKVTIEHGPLCKETTVPWGYISLTTLRGPMIVRRGFTLDNDFRVTWTDRLEVDFSSVEVDHSIDVGLFTDEMETEDVVCDHDPQSGIQHPGSEPSEDSRTRTRPRMHRRTSRSYMLPVGETYFMVRELPMKVPEPRSSDLRRIIGINAEMAEKLEAIGISDLKSLADPVPGADLKGIDPIRLTQWSDMAAILLWHPELDGEDAELLVRGLGIRTERDIAIQHGRRREFEIDSAARQLGLGAEKDRRSLKELIGATR